MSYRLLVRREAKLDLRRAARWYEEQSPGLGRELVAQVDTALNRVANNPNRCQIIYRDVRREIVQRFPYGIFYRIDGTDVVVFAIVHLHREIHLLGSGECSCKCAAQRDGSCIFYSEPVV